jgi:hypothetical protein
VELNAIDLMSGLHHFFYQEDRQDGGFPDEIRSSFDAICIEACGNQSRVFLGDTHGEIWMTVDEGDHWTCIVNDIPRCPSVAMLISSTAS